VFTCTERSGNKEPDANRWPSTLPGGGDSMTTTLFAPETISIIRVTYRPWSNNLLVWKLILWRSEDGGSHSVCVETNLGQSPRSTYKHHAENTCCL
jgi:hypothetical protein